MASSSRRFRTFLFSGRPFHLVEEEAVRRRDLEEGSVTLVCEDDGSERVVQAREVHSPPFPGQPRVSEDRLYELRLLLEEILVLGFDDRWVNEIVDFARRHGLIRQAAFRGTGS